MLKVAVLQAGRRVVQLEDLQVAQLEDLQVAQLAERQVAQPAERQVAQPVEAPQVAPQVVLLVVQLEPQVLLEQRVPQAQLLVPSLVSLVQLAWLAR